MHIMNKMDELVLSLQNTPIVCEFQDMFSNNLPGITPEKEVEFSIELTFKITLISETPFRMTLTKLQELKK